MIISFWGTRGGMTLYGVYSGHQKFLVGRDGMPSPKLDTDWRGRPFRSKTGKIGRRR